MKIKFSKEAKAGIFGIVVLFGVYWGINFLKGIEIFSDHNTFYAQYDKSDNLEVSSPVLLHGIVIGTVTATSLNEDHSKVVITMLVDSQYNIPDDSEAIITNKSMLGGKAVMLEVGQSKSYLSDGGYITGKIDNNMQEQIDDVKGKLMTTVASLTKTLESVNSILNDTTVNSINESIENVKMLTASANSTMRNNSAKIDAIMSDLSELTASLSEDAPVIMSNIRSLTDSLSGADIAATIRSADATINEINQSIEAINNQSGTIGKLLYDPAMYNNLNGAADSLKELFGNIKSEPGRYVHFSLFGRKDKSSKK